MLRNLSYDLHLHTHWSYDAFNSLESCFQHARSRGVRCIAVTDHMVLDGADRLEEAGRGYPDVRAIPAAEFTVSTPHRSRVDLLCFGLQRDDSGLLAGVLEIYRDFQRETGEARWKGLDALGLDVTGEDYLQLLRSYRPATVVDVQGVTDCQIDVWLGFLRGRGLISSPDELRPLMERMEEKVSVPPFPGVESVVPPLKQSGALVALAHPYRYVGGDEAMIDAYVDTCQADGMECAHGSVPPELTPRYRQYCIGHGLFSTGGSDAHDERDLRINFARHHGEEEWLDEFLERLERKRDVGRSGE